VPDPERRRAHAAHLLIAGVSGLAVTVLEFAAVRFMAPSFGQSNYVWANVIGVILLALSLGYWMGGRIADRSQSARPLFLAYAMAATYATAIAFVGGALCTWLVPEGISSTRMLPLAFTGSLVATVVLFAPPTLVLGMTSPFLIRLDDRPGEAGRVAGRIFAVGTIGSLAGCYLGPLFLLQTVGTRSTILLAAAALATLAVGGLVLGRRPSRRGAAAGAVVLVGALGLLGWAEATAMPLRDQAGQLAEIESGYQTIRVVETEAPLLAPGDLPLYGAMTTARTRFLRHDEDSDTYQSVWLPEHDEDYLTGGRYYQHMSLGARFLGLGAPDPDGGRRVRVLVVGYAGGAVHRALARTAPADVRIEMLGVEIDAAVVDVARDWLDLGALEGEDTRIVTGEDARTVVNALPDDERFDLVLLDAYARTAYMPFQLASLEFFETVRRHLAPGGWIGVNLHAPRGLSGALFAALAKTLDRAAGPVFAVPNPQYPGSTVLWASGREADPGDGEMPRLDGDAVARRLAAPRLRGDVPLPATLGDGAFALERLMVRYVPENATPVFTDDLSQVDRLADDELFGE
jgi:spermidine synthase